MERAYWAVIAVLVVAAVWWVGIAVDAWSSPFH
jgi:hypothetical protein